jgi:hypothetical protein
MQIGKFEKIIALHLGVGSALDFALMGTQPHAQLWTAFKTMEEWDGVHFLIRIQNQNATAHFYGFIAQIFAMLTH